MSRPLAMSPTGGRSCFTIRATVHATELPARTIPVFLVRTTGARCRPPPGARCPPPPSRPQEDEQGGAGTTCPWGCGQAGPGRGRTAVRPRPPPEGKGLSLDPASSPALESRPAERPRESPPRSSRPVQNPKRQGGAVLGSCWPFLTASPCAASKKGWMPGRFFFGLAEIRRPCPRARSQPLTASGPGTRLGLPARPLGPRPSRGP